MPFNGFRINFSSRSNTELRLEDEILVKTRENVTLEEKTTDLFKTLRQSIFQYLTAVFGRTAAVEAEDITQEAFLRLYKTLSAGQQIDNPRGWLFRVAHNLAVNRLKSQQFIAPLDDLAWEDICRKLPDAGMTPEQHTLKLEEFALLHQAIKRLSLQERECLHLRAEGFRYREIGEILGIATPTVSEFLHRAIRKLMPEGVD